MSVTTEDPLNNRNEFLEFWNFETDLCGRGYEIRFWDWGSVVVPEGCLLDEHLRDFNS